MHHFRRPAVDAGLSVTAAHIGMASFKTLDDIDVSGKAVLLRVDFNVPMRDGHVTDTTRIERSLGTILELAKGGARVVVASHMGRPAGRRINNLSLEPVARELTARLKGRPVIFAEDCIGPVPQQAIATMTDGDILVLENLRFHVGEEANDMEFASDLARLADIYVNDAFSAAHRPHASVEAITHILPSAAGRLMQAELESLAAALETPKRPVAAVIGGAKVSSKLNLLGNLIQKADVLAIGGGMANTFLHALGVDVGTSLCEREMAHHARTLLEKSKSAKCKVILPVDAVVEVELAAGAEVKVVPIKRVPKDRMILDVGPSTVENICEQIESCHTLIWNGPLGCFEVPPFDGGTNAVARKVAELSRAGSLFSVAGGGDTLAALAHAGVSDDFSYLSTAGGAFLEWLKGKPLPGVAALEKAAAEFSG